MGRDQRNNPFGLGGGATAFNASPKDRLGRPIQEGDAVRLDLAQAPIFRVSKIVPALDPRAALGTMLVHFLCTQTLVCPAGMAVNEFTRVAEAQELPPAPVEIVDQPPSAGDEGGES